METMKYKTTEEFRKEYGSFRDFYIFCMENDYEQYLMDWLDGDYEDANFESNLHDSIDQFLVHFEICEE